MKKLVPILTLCLSVFAILLSAVGLTVICISARVSAVRLIAVPVAIIGFTVSALLSPFAFIFKKDVLCKIAFFIDITAFILSVISITVWLVAL